MRSRDGNHSQLFTTGLLVLFCSFLRADEYIISYYSATKEARLINEKISISQAMTPCHGLATSELLLPYTINKNLRHIIRNNREEFLTYLQQHHLHVKNYSSKHNGIYSDLTTLSMEPQCFTVTFNENFVRISALK